MWYGIAQVIYIYGMTFFLLRFLCNPLFLDPRILTWKNAILGVAGAFLWPLTLPFILNYWRRQPKDISDLLLETPWQETCGVGQVPKDLS